MAHVYLIVARARFRKEKRELLSRVCSLIRILRPIGSLPIAAITIYPWPIAANPSKWLEQLHPESVTTYYL